MAVLELPRMKMICEQGESQSVQGVSSMPYEWSLRAEQGSG